MKNKLDSAIQIIKAARDPGSERGLHPHEGVSGSLKVWTLGLERISDKQKNRVARSYEMKLQQEKQ